MNELLDFVLVVFILNSILNVLVIAYFRTIIKEEKHLDELFSKEHEYFCEISEYWHDCLKMRGWEDTEDSHIKNFLTDSPIEIKPMSAETVKKEKGNDGVE